MSMRVLRAAPLEISLFILASFSFLLASLSSLVSFLNALLNFAPMPVFAGFGGGLTGFSYGSLEGKAGGGSEWAMGAAPL